MAQITPLQGNRIRLSSFQKTAGKHLVHYITSIEPDSREKLSAVRGGLILSYENCSLDCGTDYSPKEAKETLDNLCGIYDQQIPTVDEKEAYWTRVRACQGAIGNLPENELFHVVGYLIEHLEGRELPIYDPRKYKLLENEGWFI